MPRMLYIPKLIKELPLNNTFLYFSYRGSSWKLRDYSEGFENTVLHSTSSDYSVQKIRNMATHDLPAPPSHKHTEIGFWEKETKTLNQRHLTNNTKPQKPDEKWGVSSDHIKPGESWVIGYSERGIMNALVYEIQNSHNPNKLLRDLLYHAKFPYRNKIDKEISAAEILIEQSFSNFGDADLVLLLNTGRHRISIFAEAKVKPSQSLRWTIEGEFEKFVDGVGSRLSSSNLFTQLYHKLRMVNSFSNGGLPALQSGVSFPDCSSKPVRKIGNNPIVLKAIKKISKHLDDVYYLAVVPDSTRNIDDFFSNRLKQRGFPNLPEWDVNSFGYIAWSDIWEFCVSRKLENTLRVFSFNEGQIF